MTLFKQQDVKILQGKHDTINILAINDRDRNDFTEVFEGLMDEKEMLANNQDETNMKFGELTNVMGDILERHEFGKVSARAPVIDKRDKWPKVANLIERELLAKVNDERLLQKKREEQEEFEFEERMSKKITINKINNGENSKSSLLF